MSEHLDELQRQMNALRRERSEAMRRQLVGGAPRPRPRLRARLFCRGGDLRWAVGRRVRRVRERVARRIAPWLEDG